MKKVLWMVLVTMFILTGCSGSGQASQEDIQQNPKAVTQTNGDVFYYGSTKETIEEIMGTDSEPAIRGMDNYLEYPDNTKILYREDQAVLLMFGYRQYTTYQGISVGDKWEEVKGKLGEIAEVENMALILFDGEEQIDPWIQGEDREDDWLSISYWMDEDGLIKMIAISDHLAGYAMK